MLHRRISAATCAAFPASYMVLTFHVAMVVVFLVDRRVVGTLASFRLWTPHVILPAGAGPFSPRTGVSWAVVNASVAISVFGVRVLTPRPTFPEGPGLFFEANVRSSPSPR